MMKIYFKQALLITGLSLSCISTNIVNADVGTVVDKTKVDLSFRYRFETVDQDSLTESAEASTMRTRATVTTNWTDHFDSVFEFDDVTALGFEDYNSGAGTSPGRAQYPVVADPVGTELNQGFIRYTNDDTKIAIGRQRILVNNQRYVGGVGWRQNEQTYDSASLKTKLTDDLSINYAFVFNVNRIFGENVPAGDHNHNTHLLNVDYAMGVGKLSGYYFLIDNEDAVSLSNSTLGIRYSATLDAFNYNLEFASQSDAGDNPNSYDANYYLLEGNYKVDNMSFGAGFEVLGGDVAGGQAFTTSLATLHKFQGWADVFLATPAAGIEDLYLNASFNVDDYTLKAVYHDFATDQEVTDLGTEIDFVISTKFNKQLSGLIKFASFDSDNLSYVSRDKVWLMVSYAVQ